MAARGEAHETKAQGERRPPCPAHGHARPVPFDPRHPLGRLLLALDTEPCNCKSAAGDAECLRWHVLPAAHRLHPDDWHRLLAAWSRQDFGEAREPQPAQFEVPAGGLSGHAAEDACRQARLEVYEERAARRQSLCHPQDVQRAGGRVETTADRLAARGLVEAPKAVEPDSRLAGLGEAARAFLMALERECAA